MSGQSREALPEWQCPVTMALCVIDDCNSGGCVRIRPSMLPVSDSVSAPCAVCGGSGSVYVGDHDGAARYATCDCTKPAVSPPTPGTCRCDCHNPMLGSLVVHHVTPCCDRVEPAVSRPTPEPPASESLIEATARWLRDLALAFEGGRLPNHHAPHRLRASADAIDSLRAALVVAEAARNTAEQASIEELRLAYSAGFHDGKYTGWDFNQVLIDRTSRVAGRVVPTGGEQ